MRRRRLPIHDHRADAKRDFLNDDAYWEHEIANPSDFYVFAPPCTNLSRAKTVPIVRTSENPYGNEADPAIKTTNEIVRVH